MSEITLTGPVTLILQPQSVALIVQALGEIPYKQARPVIDEILAQLSAKPVNSDS